MAINDYYFVSHWRVEATPAEVYEILDNANDLPRWWPSVYLRIDTLEPGDANGVGKLVRAYTKGWLPYTLDWQFRVTEKRPPQGFTIQALGDFVGTGVWSFVADGPLVNITYEWRITAEKPLLRALSFLLKPIFSANHRWAMRRGEESLKLELARRHAKSAEERAMVPAPPRPTFVRKKA